MLSTYIDYRLGGIPRYYIANREDNMLVPDEVRKSVVYITYQRKKDGQMALGGTGFLVSVEQEGINFVYIVTAKHVIVDCTHSSNDQKIYLRMNTRDGNAEYVGVESGAWQEHPTDTSVDVNILAWAPPRDKFDYLTIPSSMVATKDVITSRKIGVGDEVFFTGLFVNHFGTKRNLPIVRIGNIAMMPEEKIPTKKFGSIEAYIVEARSIGGLSGSPAFVHLGGARQVGGTIQIGGGSTFHLLGLMHGHWDLSIDESNTDVIASDSIKKEAVNMGMAIVVPAEKIMEIINQDDNKKTREKLVKKEQEKVLPVEDGASNSEEFSQEDMNQALKKAFKPQVDNEGQTSGEEKSKTSE